MPRQLALLICTAFVFYLLRYDRKARAGVSWVLWLPSLWMLCVSTRSVDAWLGVSGGGREAGGILDPIFQCTLFCVGLIILSRRGLNWVEFAKSNGWLVILICYMLLSLAWSEITFIAFKRWVREITAVVMALLVMTEQDPQKAMQSIFRKTVYVLIPFSILLIKYYQYLGILYSRHSGDIQWTGVTLQKNSLGRLCLVSMFFLLWTFFRRWRKQETTVAKYQTHFEVLLFFMTIWLFRGPSQWAASATALYSFGVGLLTFFSLLVMRKYGVRLAPGTFVVIMAAVIVLGITTPLVGGSTVQGFTSAVGRDSTLTGRTEIWASLLPDVSKRSLLGYGFGSFWTVNRIVRHDIAEAHSGYLELWLGLGVVGLFFTSMFLLSSIRKAAKLLDYNYDWANLTICFLLMTAVHNITESSIDSFTTQLTAIILFLSISVPTILYHGDGSRHNANGDDSSRNLAFTPQWQPSSREGLFGYADARLIYGRRQL